MASRERKLQKIGQKQRVPEEQRESAGDGRRENHLRGEFRVKRGMGLSNVSESDPIQRKKD